MMPLKVDCLLAKALTLHCTFSTAGGPAQLLAEQG